MKYPCRCNKRSCQARRTLHHHPEWYLKPQTCDVDGCTGKMYVDNYRLNKGKFDRAPQCKDPNCNFSRKHFERSGHTMIKPHRVDNDLCDGHSKYLTERNLKPQSTHSPIPKELWVPF